MEALRRRDIATADDLAVASSCDTLAKSMPKKLSDFTMADAAPCPSVINDRYRPSDLQCRNSDHSADEKAAAPRRPAMSARNGQP